MSNETQFNVERAENGLTLQQFLASRLALSRSAAKGLIDQRRVFVNGRRIWMARHCLRTGDTVGGVFQREEKPSVSRSLIIYEDNDYLIANKPAGILSNGPGSLEQELRNLTDNRDLAACHRLDRDTSGCLIFAKHAKAKERIIELFEKNQVQKKYEAVVKGFIAEKSFSVTRPIEGQSAVSHVRVPDSNSSASHVLISIETGRTHQIRKHLSSIGHPVLGDRQYGVGRAISPVEKTIPRQMLHACEISFINPQTGRTIRCLAKMPVDIMECLRKFRLR